MPRADWSFPKSADDLIYALETQERRLVENLSQSFTEEQMDRKETLELRQTLKEMGVAGWEDAQPTKKQGRGQRYEQTHYRDVWLKQLAELRTFKDAIERDKKREPNRLYKLNYNDLHYFGFDGQTI